MLDLAPISYAIGLVVAVLGSIMAIPALVEFLEGTAAAADFLYCSAVSVAAGALFAIPFHGQRSARLSVRQALILVAALWIAVPVFGSLPFLVAIEGLSLTDAIFESMSGFTTTGSTILDNLEERSPGILLWRGLLQWIGGIAVVIVAILFLPRIGLGGMALFRSSLGAGTDNIQPRTRSVFMLTCLAYAILSVLCAATYLSFDLRPLEAIVLAMTTIATGGFGTRDASFAEYPPAIEYAAILFMLLASLPFLRYVQFLEGRFRPILRDSQIRTFLLTAATVVLMLVLWLLSTSEAGFEEVLRKSLFNGVSILTGTGYASAGYDNWGGFAVTLFLLAGLIGGCAGSTTCSIKVFRFQVLVASLSAELRRIRNPLGVYTPRYERQAIPPAVISSVSGFFFLFAASLITLTVLLSMTGLDLLTAASGAATALANVGPGLGPDIGPEGNFSSLPDAAKWLLTFGMLLGRLEILGVLVLFQLSFWRD